MENLHLGNYHFSTYEFAVAVVSMHDSKVFGSSPGTTIMSMLKWLHPYSTGTINIMKKTLAVQKCSLLKLTEISSFSHSFVNTFKIGFLVIPSTPKVPRQLSVLLWVYWYALTNHFLIKQTYYEQMSLYTLDEAKIITHQNIAQNEVTIQQPLTQRRIQVSILTEKNKMRK